MTVVTPTPRPTPLSLSRPTAPLPPLAAAALSRLERSSIAPAVVKAVAQYETAAMHAAHLASKAALRENLPAIDVRSWEFAEELMAGARAVLAEAGQLALIGGGR